MVFGRENYMLKEFKKKIGKLIARQGFKRKVERYARSLGPQEEFKIILGGHWSDHPGWLILDENDQDITRPLVFADNSVDVIFTEHVVEHLDFLACVFFFRETIRILKHGGLLRIVCPMIEKILSVSFDDAMSRSYMRYIARRIYKEEDEVLKTIGLCGLSESPRVFLWNNLFLKHGHKFIWSAELMMAVLKALGYADVRSYEFDKGGSEEYCINRKRRGIYLGNDWEEDASAGYSYDAESMAIEAKK